MGRKKICPICQKTINKNDEKKLITDSNILIMCSNCYKKPCWNRYKKVI